MSEFYEGLADILEVDVADIGPETELGENWDSLAVVSTIALIDEVYGHTVDVGELADCKTVAELETVARGRAG